MSFEDNDYGCASENNMNVKEAYVICSVFAEPQHLRCKDLEQVYVLTAKTSLRQVEAARQCTRFMRQAMTRCRAPSIQKKTMTRCGSNPAMHTCETQDPLSVCKNHDTWSGSVKHYDMSFRIISMTAAATTTST